MVFIEERNELLRQVRFLSSELELLDAKKFSRPFHGLLSPYTHDPSSELLGYCQSSASRTGRSTDGEAEAMAFGCGISRTEKKSNVLVDQ